MSVFNRLYHHSRPFLLVIRRKALHHVETTPLRDTAVEFTRSLFALQCTITDSEVVLLGYFTYLHVREQRTLAAVASSAHRRRPLQLLVDVAVYRRGWSCCLPWRQWEDEEHLLGGG